MEPQLVSYLSWTLPTTTTVQSSGRILKMSSKFVTTLTPTIWLLSAKTSLSDYGSLKNYNRPMNFHIHQTIIAYVCRPILWDSLSQLVSNLEFFVFLTLRTLVCSRKSNITRMPSIMLITVLMVDSWQFWRKK